MFVNLISYVGAEETASSSGGVCGLARFIWGLQDGGGEIRGGERGQGADKGGAAARPRDFGVPIGLGGGQEILLRDHAHVL